MAPHPSVRHPGLRAALMLACLALLAAGCRLQGLNFIEGTRVEITGPAHRSQIELPVTVEWEVTDFEVTGPGDVAGPRPRFDGAAKDLLARDDLLRAVFLEGVSKGAETGPAHDRARRGRAHGEGGWSMTELLERGAVPALAAARAAAHKAGVVVRPLQTLGEMRAASDLVDVIWAGDHVPVNLQRAVAHAGSYLAGALRDGQVVGVLIGFLGLQDEGLVLHSHVAGVLPGDQGRNVGFALKLHQRAWSLERDVRRVTWTFDPLVRRNAYFNLTKLGAVGARYAPNFYGTMEDGINDGDESDRLVVAWRLDEPGVAAAAEGRTAAVDAPALRSAGAGVLLEVAADGSPVVRDEDGDVLLCQVPDDIVALRTDPAGRALAARWRSAARHALGSAFDRGLEASAMSRDGWYVFTDRPRPGP